MKNTIIICLLVIMGCKDKTQANIEISKTDSFKNSLIGKWGGSEENGCVWEITRDSLYYYDQNKSYPYAIVGNDLVINMGESKPRLKDVSVKRDTLFFYTKVSMEKEIYGLTKAFRCK
ncbi:MAG: hypothetical protein ACR2KZ_02535 [Segetibacter sp.]